MNVLVIAAHCDDELLGCGCYIKKLVSEGHDVRICCMTSYAPTREEDIEKKMLEIHKEIGVAKTYIAPYTALSIDNIPHIEKVQFIEKAIVDSKCSVVITHSNLDLHKDHVEVSNLTMEAIRYYQRRPETDNLIEKVMFMEIPCSGLWGEERFNPNFFVETSKEDVVELVGYVERYNDVIRKSPHPRSIENILALAKVRGAQSGVEYAQGFATVFELEKSL